MAVTIIPEITFPSFDLPFFTVPSLTLPAVTIPPTPSNTLDVYGSSEADIQNAINKLSSKTSRIIVPHGKYDINASILAPSYTKLDFTDAILKATAGLNAPMIKNSDQINGNTDISIVGGEIDGNKASRAPDTRGMQNMYYNYPSGRLIEIVCNPGGRSNNIKIESVYMHSAPSTAIQFVNTFNSLIDKKCKFENNKEGVDIYLNNGINSWEPCYDVVDDCDFNNNSIASSPGMSKQITFKNSRVSNCTDFGLFCDGSEETNILNNTFDNCVPAAIAGGCPNGAPTANLDIENNMFRNSSGYAVAIACGNYGGHKILNNTASNIATGLQISQGNLTNTQIRGNNGFGTTMVTDIIVPGWIFCSGYGWRKGNKC